MENENWYENGWIVMFVIAALVVGVFLLIRFLKKDKGKPLPPGGKPLCLNDSIEAKMKASSGSWAKMRNTASGVQVYGAVDYPDVVLPVIDAAVLYSIEIQKVQHPNWTADLNPSEWEVFMMKADGKGAESGLPYLTIGTTNSAGTIAFCTPPAANERNPIIIPDFALVDWQRLADLFWYIVWEGEHRRERRNDLAVFNEFVGAFDSHPHRPLPASVPIPPEGQFPRGLVAMKAAKFECGFGVK